MYLYLSNIRNILETSCGTISSHSGVCCSPISDRYDSNNSKSKITSLIEVSFVEIEIQMKISISLLLFFNNSIHQVIRFHRSVEIRQIQVCQY